MALQRCLQKEGAPEEKLTKVLISPHQEKKNKKNNLKVCLPEFMAVTSLPQMVSKLSVMKTICNLHIDKLEFFRLVHPETAYTFPPLYREVFGSEITFPDSTEG